MALISDIVSGILKPISDVVAHLTVSGDEKAKIQGAIVQGQINAVQSTLDYEKQLLEGQQAIIKAEASSGSFLAANWRPITALTFLALVVLDSFGWLHSPLAPQAWTLLQVMIGGYTAGRSLEKLAPVVIGAMKK